VRTFIFARRFLFFDIDQQDLLAINEITFFEIRTSNLAAKITLMLLEGAFNTKQILVLARDERRRKPSYFVNQKEKAHAARAEK
jgi:hypothetical protein